MKSLYRPSISPKMHQTKISLVFVPTTVRDSKLTSCAELMVSYSTTRGFMILEERKNCSKLCFRYGDLKEDRFEEVSHLVLG